MPFPLPTQSESYLKKNKGVKAAAPICLSSTSQRSHQRWGTLALVGTDQWLLGPGGSQNGAAGLHGEALTLLITCSQVRECPV